MLSVTSLVASKGSAREALAQPKKRSCQGQKSKLSVTLQSLMGVQSCTGIRQLASRFVRPVAPSGLGSRSEQ